MRANCWMGRNKLEVRTVPDPQILSSRDAIVKITATAICGSDLHLYDGYIPTMRKGDVLGHEFMGEIVELGSGVSNLSLGDRVVVPFPIACGSCYNCKRELYSVCENSNPNAAIAEKLMGHSPAAIYGYSHMLGGFAGGQAEYARVPFADVGPIKIESDLTDEQVLFLSDVFPTAFMGADMAVSPGDVVAIWGAGPIGMFAAASAKMLGAERVIVIDRFDYRLDKVAKHTGADTINYADVAVLDALNEMTAGRGPDACIEAVGLEAHSANPAIHAYDRVKQAARQETERPEAVREAILACRTGGTVSIMGAYGGFADKFPLGQMMNKGLTIRTGQCHVQRYLKPLLGRIEAGEIDPTFIISHRMKLEQAPEAYEMFKNKTDDCTKVVLTP
jgi:threonine dehydrogenase-like Zn-dependent dehydrogenase